MYLMIVIKPMKKKKINHDFTCTTCDKPATINLCNSWHKYYIDENGDYSDEVDNWEGETGIDLCDDCYQKGNY